MMYYFSLCGGGLEYLHHIPVGHPVTGGHKYRDLVLQVGGWMQGL
jgi:hypothetical protein